MRRSFEIKTMIYKYNQKLVKNAQALRNNMTGEEIHLWLDFLKKLPVTVYRQKNIGNYIVDFFIASKRVVIEIDGLQHTMIENQEADKIRDEELQNLGIKVLRYTNFEVNNNFNTVCNDILKNIGIDARDLKK